MDPARLNELFRVLKAHYRESFVQSERTALDHLIYACLLEGATPRAADKGLQSLRELFFDWNEVRVTSIAETARALDMLPDSRAASRRVKGILQSIFEATYKSKLQVKSVKDLHGIRGISPFALAYVDLVAFQGHRIPVTEGATAVLQAAEAIDQSSKIRDGSIDIGEMLSTDEAIEFALLLYQVGSDWIASRYPVSLKDKIHSIGRTPIDASGGSADNCAISQADALQAAFSAQALQDKDAERQTERRSSKLASANYGAEQAILVCRPFVQACISTIGFPQSVDDFIEMISWRYRDEEDPEFALNMDALIRQARRTESREISEDVTTIESWTAPRWFTQGDIMFFYHSVRAKKWTRMIAHRLKNGEGRRPGKKASWRKRLDAELESIVERAIEQSDKFGGAIFACGRCSGPIEREEVGDSYWKGTIYAPLNGLSLFENPVPLKQFEHIVRISQTTITPLFRDGFAEIVTAISKRNALPLYVSEARIGNESLRDLGVTNWRRINATNVVAFVAESQIREYFIDYLLEELKDVGTSVVKECNCHRNGTPTGIADYFVMVSGRWIPVEAKVNVLAEAAIDEQLEQYANLSSFRPTVEPEKGRLITVEAHGTCLVVDTHGIYLRHNGQWVDCIPGRPLHRRVDLESLNIEALRVRIAATR